MIKKQLIIVISFLLEGTSKLLLIKVIHQGATVPFLEALAPGASAGLAVSHHARCLINAANIDGCEFLPQPKLQHDGSMLPKHGEYFSGHSSAPPQIQVSA